MLRQNSAPHFCYKMHLYCIIRIYLVPVSVLLYLSSIDFNLFRINPSKKVSVAHTRLPSVGFRPELIPFLAVSLQVT